MDGRIKFQAKETFFFFPGYVEQYEEPNRSTRSAIALRGGEKLPLTPKWLQRRMNFYTVNEAFLHLLDVGDKPCKCLI